MTLHLLRYNNYYNRIIKRYDTIAEYEDYILESFSNINFNPNDGITAEQIINYHGPIPDYVIVTSGNEIVSRWFVIESVRTRAQQFKLDLYRDTVADYLDFIKSAPMFIEKATLAANSPFLFNKEDMTFNQIKTSETLLKDNTGCPWIVGYYAKDASDDFLHGVVQTEVSITYDKAINTTFGSWQYNATENPFYGKPTIEYRIYCKAISTDIGHSQYPAYYTFDQYGNYLSLSNRVPNESSLTVPNYGGYNVGPTLKPEFQSRTSQLYSAAEGYIPNYNSDSNISTFLGFNNKIIKDINGKYYSLSIYQESIVDEEITIGAGSLFNLMNAIVKTTALIKGDANANSFKIKVTRPTYRMVAHELRDNECTWDLRNNNIITGDAPYNIFAIPYGTTQLEYSGYAQATSSEAISMATAESIIRTMGSNLYDIQLLPYCPVDVAGGNGVLQVYDADMYSIVKAPGDTLDSKIGYILRVPRAKFSKNLNYPLPAPQDSVEIKVSNECDMYRLCSPNYNGYFEFSVAKNKGVYNFNVDCEYKPFQPYIHVNPNFGGLYGRDFDDARGLICGGDFSLTQIEDKWQQYQIQNKNYQEIFSRQIENMEIQQKYQRIGDIVGSVTGAGSAAVSGAMMGSMIAPGVGTAVGAISGTALSAVGGIADYAINEKLRTEALDYTKDQFGYQLGNIQALPYALTKVSAFNNNNKLFPFIEYYTCTADEKEAFRNKLRYNGMTVGVIGTMNDYLLPTESYIKGKLIRLENVEDDFHIANIISNELNKGVFI